MNADEEAPEEVGAALPAGGGDPVAEVERSVGRLGELDELPVAEHVTRFEEVHSALTEALASVDRA